MKKFNFTLTVLIALSIKTTAQIPNNDFENWKNNIIVNPGKWQTFGKITQVTPGFSGNFAIRIERDPVNSDAPGAILYGTPQGNAVSGGIPFAGRPDSLVGYFKYNIVTGDSAWILFALKLNGIPVSSDTGYFTGTDTAKFKRIAFKVTYLSGEIPDSLIIAVTSTNPNSRFTGSYIIVDSLHFTNTALTIPNGGFETWVNDTDAEPVNWYTSNKYYLSNPALPVTKTTDSYSGNYALRIENVNYVNGLAVAFAFAGPQSNNGPLPGFPVSERKLFLEGYYKYYPQNNDSLMIGVIMFNKGTRIGSGFFQSKTPKSSYTHFVMPIYYSYGYTGTPDSATVLLLPFDGGQSPHGNSVLFVDSVGFNNLIKLDQTITFGALSNKKVNDPSFELIAYSSSRFPVSFTSSNLNVAIINGNTVVIQGAGTTDITASQVGNEYFNPATPVTHTLIVLPNTGIGAVTSEMLKIYPSPATGTVFIQSTILMNNISIYDLHGMMINQYQLNSIMGIIDISQLSKGLYFVKIQCGGTEYLRKIEKK